MADIKCEIKEAPDQPLTTAWSYEESITLINSVKCHYSDMNHPLKRKHLWNIVSAELEALDYTRSANQCRDKWQNLLRTYITCKDNINKTGRGATRFYYYKQMDVFLGHTKIDYKRRTVRAPVITNVNKNHLKRQHNLSEAPERITNALGNYLAFKIEYLKKKEEEKQEEREKRQQRHNEIVEMVSKVMDVYKEKH